MAKTITSLSSVPVEVAVAPSDRTAVGVEIGTPVVARRREASPRPDKGKRSGHVGRRFSPASRFRG